MKDIFSIAALLLYVAMLSLVISSPYTQGIIKSLMGGYSGLISAAKG